MDKSLSTGTVVGVIAVVVVVIAAIGYWVFGRSGSGRVTEQNRQQMQATKQRYEGLMRQHGMQPNLPTPR